MKEQEYFIIIGILIAFFLGVAWRMFIALWKMRFPGGYKRLFNPRELCKKLVFWVFLVSVGAIIALVVVLFS